VVFGNELANLIFGMTYVEARIYLMMNVAILVASGAVGASLRTR
jgi:hypothetical protein